MELEPLKQSKDENKQAETENWWSSVKPVVEKVDERPRWGSRCEFLLAIVGYTVGIGNIWRFPILCARNGGGAFLIPFFFFMITCGGPLYYLEVSLGQFSGRSAGIAFEFCPLLKGIGLLMVVLSFNVMWYYVAIMGWIQYYLVHSFLPDIPWATCGNWWNTDSCRENPSSNLTTFAQNSSDGNLSAYETATLHTTPSVEFWTHNVLRKSTGLEDMGSIQPHLAASAFVGWVLVVAALIKGVRSLGKVVYVTALAPYVLLTVLLVRGLTLDGALDGVVWYVTPEFKKLASSQVWLDAAIQVFYSLGPAYGGVITMASHNKFHQKSVIETSICVASDAFTAFYAGLVVFSCIGFMAHEAGVSVEEAAKASGLGLAFVAYPEALTRMPLPQLWSVLFFLTLTTVIFDSAFGTFETVTGSIVDMFPRFFRKSHWMVSIGVALVLYLISLPFYTNGGIYLFQLADWYVSTFAVLGGSVLESILFCWIYGADRLAHDIEAMTGRKSSVLLRILWCVCVPLFLSIAFFITVATYREPDYGDSYVYKPYAIIIGLIISILPFIPILVVMVQELYCAKGTLLQRIRTLLRPSEKWAPHDEQTKEIYRLRPYRYEDTLFKRIRRDLLGDKGTPWI